MTEKPHLTFVTDNKEKMADIQEILGNLFDLKFISNLNLIEIQTLSVSKVVEFKVKQAFNQLNIPVAVSDSGLNITSLQNFPGALVKYANETIGQEGIIQLMKEKENRQAYFIAAIGYCDEKSGPIVFIEKDEGIISEKPRGRGWHFDKIFIPLGETKTWAEIGRKNKNKHSAFRRALEKLAHWYSYDRL